MSSYQEQGQKRHQDLKQVVPEHDSGISDSSSSPGVVECKSCGKHDTQGTQFCSECGALFEERTFQCQDCGTSSTGRYCSECGSDLVPKACSSCGALGTSEFCAQCGTPRSNVLELLEQQFFDAQSASTMTEAEAEEIERTFSRLNTSAHDALLRTLRDREILRRERNYAQEREQRIIEFRTRSGFALVKQSAHDLEAIRRAQSSLEAFQARKLAWTGAQNESIERERENQREQARIAELLRRAQAEAEERSRLQARQAELVKEELAYEAARRERFWNRLGGVYVWSTMEGNGVDTQTISISVSGTEVTGTSRHVASDDKGRQYDIICTFRGTFDGESLGVRTTSRRDVYLRENWVSLNWAIQAKVSSDGEIISGPFRNSADRVYQGKWFRQ